VATAEAIEAVSGVSATIKWVNDVYTNGRKTAGILTETALAPDGSLSFAIVGIGVNLFAPEGGFPQELCASALFPEQKRTEFVSLRAALSEAICARFGTLYDRLPQSGFLEEYRRRSFLLGKEVLIYDALTDSEKKGGGTPARVLAITDNGLLLVRFKTGEERALLAGDVTLKPASAK
jgi:BirA family biotin operon repressor/biotin-[acetyl-CoA-carboxylase] ligase